MADLAKQLAESSENLTTDARALCEKLASEVGSDVDFQGGLYQHLDQRCREYRQELAQRAEEVRRAECALDLLKAAIQQKFLLKRISKERGSYYEVTLRKVKPKLVIENESELLKDLLFQKKITRVALDEEMVLAKVLTSKTLSIPYAHLEDAYEVHVESIQPKNEDVGKGSSL